MKKVMMFLFAAVMVSLTSFAANSQDGKDYFVGTWNCLTTGLPQGDAKSNIVLERVDGKLEGYQMDTKGAKTVFSRVEEKPSSVTVYFTSNAYNVYIYLEKVDDNHMTGSTMDMFDTTAERAVANDQTKKDSEPASN